jgi:hypothetical protein
MIDIPEWFRHAATAGEGCQARRNRLVGGLQ